MKKRTILSLAWAASLLVACGSGAYGQTVNIDRIQGPSAPLQPDYGGNSPAGVTNTDEGGEFTVIPTDTTLLNSYVLGSGGNTATGTRVTDPGDRPSGSDASLAGDVGFQTFCLELNVTINSLPTGPLAYTISPSVLNGGTKLGGLANGTAYLYSLFAQGTLSGYDYVDYKTDGGGNPSVRGNDAAYLQAAIWYLEGDVTLADADNTNNVYLEDLFTAGLLNSALTGAGINGNALAFATADEYGVEVLNLGSPANNYDYQAMLVYQTPSIPTAPDGGSNVSPAGCEPDHIGGVPPEAGLKF